MPKIVVEGPDGRKFAFPDTMPQSEINAFMRNKYGTKSRNETVDQYLARVVREEDATKARARDTDRRAAETGRAEGERAAERMGVTNPLMMAVAAPAIGMAQQAGARPVYEREGTILPDEAAGLSAINAAGFFIPGMVNQRFGQRLEEGRRQEPVAAFAGDIAGGFPSGEVIGLGLQKAGQAIAPGIAALGRLFQGRQSISPEVQATLQQTAVGSIGGSAYGSQNDVNNDGVIDENDAYAGALAGGLGLPAGIKGAQVAGDLMQVPRGAAEAIPAGSNPYLNRRSMRPEAPAGPGEATQALREEWRPLMPSIAQARATAEDAIRLAEQARTPQQIEQAKAALGTLRNQVSEMRAARGGAATPEDQRIDDIIESLQPTNDPIFMGTQASAARQSLDRLGQSLGFEQAGPRGRQAIYDEALFDLRGDAPLGMNNEIKVVTEPVIAPDGTVLRKGVAEAVTGAELPISTGRAPPRTVLPRGADQPSEPRGPGRYAAGQGDEIKPQGFGAGTPNTPQQAARFETPGSPEYEAAVAKGLNMSTEARMARAREMGFDTDEVFYHGTGDLTNFSVGFDPNMTGLGNDQLGSGFYFTNQAETASGYTTRRLPTGESKLGGEDAPGVLPVVLNIKNPIVLENGTDMLSQKVEIAAEQAEAIIRQSPLLAEDLDDNPLGNWHDIWSEGVQDWMIGDVASSYEGNTILSIENDFFKGHAEAFRRAVRDVLGYDGVIQKFDNGEVHKVAWFPEQVRSVHAAFDPDKATSSTLLAAAPFAAVGGAGMTAERELGARMKEKGD